jgi:hypothetical protein
MIKAVAAALMVIDHIGYIFFPDVLIWRLIGRLSMPLFAYGIAKGYEYSRQKGALWKYFWKLVLFSAVSRIPFYLMTGEGGNIGFTWASSLLLLIIVGRRDISRPRAILECLEVLAAAYILNVDYGIYGVLMPFVMGTQKGYSRMFLYTVMLWGLYVLMNGAGGMIQVASCAAVPVLAVLKLQDEKIRLPKSFFYVFYPAHMLILLMIKRFL